MSAVRLGNERPTFLIPALILLILSFGVPDRLEAEPTNEETPVRHLYLGMWTIHFGSLDRGLDNNWLVGVLWGQIYGATFVNSYGDRGYSVGLQKKLSRGDVGPVPLHLGYRLGVVSGYDERFIGLASTLPVLPMVQLLVSTGSRVGFELSFAGPIASAVFSVRL